VSAAAAWLASPARVLIGASAVLATVANTALWWGAWRKADRPVVASWAEWAALMGIGAAATAETGKVPAAVYGGFCALGCLIVVPLALRVPAADRDRPVRVAARFTPGGEGARLDLLLLPAVLAGLMLLCTPLFPAGRVYVHTETPAVIVTVATDALAFLPVVGHAWQQPGHEPWMVYGLFAGGAAASLAAAFAQGQGGTLTAVAYPLYLTVAELSVAVLIVARRAAVSRAGKTLGWRRPPPVLPVPRRPAGEVHHEDTSGAGVTADRTAGV
jgi:hypothetical protein